MDGQLQPDAQQHDDDAEPTAASAAASAASDRAGTTLSFSSSSSPLSSPLSAPCSFPSSAACEHSEVLAEHKQSIRLLQQDVFALRHLLESEMSKMKQQVKQSMTQLEARLMQAVADARQQTDAAVAAGKQGSTATCAAAAAVAAKETGDSAGPKRSSSSSAAAAAAVRRVWSGDFLDSDCGDEFAPSHPSQLEEKEQSSIIAAIMRQHDKPDKTDDALHSTAERQAAPAQPPPAAAAGAAPGLPPLLPSSSGSHAPLSIHSLTALINPAGLPLSESQLIALACRILSDHGSVPVGKMGSLLHKAANDHTLPQLLKERYGGLKKFLQAQSAYFVLGEDHPYNPHVALLGHQQLPAIAQPQAAPASAPSSSSCSASQSAAPSALPHTAHMQPAAADSSHSSPIRGAGGVDFTVGSANDAYARSLVDSALMDDRDSLFSSPCCAASSSPARKPLVQHHSLSALSSVPRPFFPSSNPSSSSPSSLASYSARLHDSLSRASPSAPASSSSCPSELLASLSAQMDSLLTDVVAVDCEMVGCGADGSRSLLARASIVSYDGHILYDAFVQPAEPVSDYRTHVSGIRPGDLDPPRAISFHQAQREVQDLIQGRVLVAHSVVADLQALGLSHPPQLLRDTAHFPLLCPERPRSLRSLVVERLGWTDFQCGEHDSVDDARAVMRLYRLVEDEWEAVMSEEREREEREQKAAAAKSAATARQRAMLIEQQRQQLHQQRTAAYSAFSPPSHAGVYGGCSGVSPHHNAYGSVGSGFSSSRHFASAAPLTPSSASFHLQQLHSSTSSSPSTIHAALWK